MADFESERYGEVFADIYDSGYTAGLDTDGAVARLAELAGAGPVLELGAGTGRLALPLARRGLPVHVIEISEEMIRLLSAKPDQNLVRIHQVDMSSFDLPESFSLVFAAFNTLCMLQEQSLQVQCLRTAADHLRPGGRLVIESQRIGPMKETGTMGLRAWLGSEDQVTFAVSESDPISQLSTQMMVVVGTSGNCFYPVTGRYVWPSELDLMAQLAGLEFESRWADWNRSEFTSSWSWAVSVYRRPSG